MTHEERMQSDDAYRRLYESANKPDEPEDDGSRWIFPAFAVCVVLILGLVIYAMGTGPDQKPMDPGAMRAVNAPVVAPPAPVAQRPNPIDDPEIDDEWYGIVENIAKFDKTYAEDVRRAMVDGKITSTELEEIRRRRKEREDAIHHAKVEAIKARLKEGK